MTRILVLILLFTAIGPGGFAQTKPALAVIPASGSQLRDFIPKGFDTLLTATGDLNKDGVDDLVVVLRPDAENDVPSETEADIPERFLIVLFREKNVYRLAGRSDESILCKSCGGAFGDPLAGVWVEKGVLLVHHYAGSAWRWANTEKYRYQKGDFYLIGKTTTSYWNVEQCEKLDEFAGTKFLDENFITGDYEQKEVSEEGCKLLVNKKGKKKIKPLVKLADYKQEN